MTFIKVVWLHKDTFDPVEMYSELDEARWELRKVEVFADGSMTHADNEHSTGTTGLGLVEMPSIEELAAYPEYIPTEISRSEFERIWAQANDRGPTK